MKITTAMYAKSHNCTDHRDDNEVAESKMKKKQSSGYEEFYLLGYNVMCSIENRQCFGGTCHLHRFGGTCHLHHVP
jgi:hypothetical protein